MCCNLIPPSFPCVDFDAIRIDLYSAMERLNIDLSPHIGFIETYIHDLTVCSFGLTIKWKDFEFDAAIYNKETAILIKSGTDQFKTVFKKGLHAVVMAAYNARDEKAEKDMWRERLRAVGIEPKW